MRAILFLSYISTSTKRTRLYTYTIHHMKTFFITVYQYLETIPDTFYPFRREIEGKWVRGQRAYQQVIQEGFLIFGPGKMSYQMVIYRGVWHLIGSIISITLITFIANDIFGSEIALYILLGAAIIALCVQEFLRHPKRYNQSTRKGILDVCTWVTPVVVYLLFLVS